MIAAQIGKRAKRKARHMLGAVPPGSRFMPRAEDIMLVSYPRSGNTWARFLLGNLVHDTPTTFANLEQRVPDIYVCSRARIACLGRRRIIKSHEPLRHDYQRVIYLVRDPRDVALSFYKYRQKMRGPAAEDWPDYLAAFLSGSLGFGGWGEHVREWCDRRSNDPDFFVVTYEQLLEQTADCLRRMADFMGLDIPDNQLAKSVETASFENMQMDESRTGANWRPLQRSDPGIRFIRQGQAGGWRESLSPADAQRIHRQWPDIVGRFGYEP